MSENLSSGKRHSNAGLFPLIFVQGASMTADETVEIESHSFTHVGTVLKTTRTPSGCAILMMISLQLSDICMALQTAWADWRMVVSRAL